jgi:hypothetical protein
MAVGAAVVAAALGVLGVGVSIAKVPPGRARRWLDRGVLLLLGMVTVAAVVGPVVFLVAGPPGDWLHLLYAAIALGAVPVARALAAWRRSTRMGLWMAVGSLITLGALLRLWMTGG